MMSKNTKLPLSDLMRIPMKHIYNAEVMNLNEQGLVNNEALSVDHWPVSPANYKFIKTLGAETPGRSVSDHWNESAGMPEAERSEKRHIQACRANAEILAKDEAIKTKMLGNFDKDMIVGDPLKKGFFCN